jgi:hypothetical protein
VDLHPTPLEYQQSAGAARKRRAPLPLDESEFPREEPPAGPRGRKKILDDGSVAPICGGSSAERARPRRNPRGGNPRQRLRQEAGRPVAGRRRRRRARRIGEFQRGFAGFGTGSGERLGDERIWSAGFRTGFFLPWEIFCASGGLVNFSWGGACVWWCTCLSRRGGRETLSETVAFSAPPVRPSLSLLSE